MWQVLFAEQSFLPSPAKDIATEFAGRGDEVHMYPLSFAEFMTVYQGDKYMGLSEYMLYGGIPLVVLREGTNDKAVALQNLYFCNHKKYMDYFEDSFLIESTQRYDIKGKAYIETPKKYPSKVHSF